MTPQVLDTCTGFTAYAAMNSFKLEIFSPSKRKAVIVAAALYPSGFLVPLVLHFTRHWQWLHWVAGEHPNLFQELLVPALI